LLIASSAFWIPILSSWYICNSWYFFLFWGNFLGMSYVLSVLQIFY
jgi:hypothetical protein